MKWFLLILEVLLATVANTQVQVPEVLTIKKIQKQISSGFFVEFETAYNFSIKVEKYHIIATKNPIPSPPGQFDDDATNAPQASEKLIFLKDLPAWENEQVDIVLQGLPAEENTIIISGEAFCQDFPKFSKDFVMQYVNTENSNPAESLLRLAVSDKGDMTKFVPDLTSGDELTASSSLIRYFVGDYNVTDFAICHTFQNTDNAGVDICEEPSIGNGNSIANTLEVIEAKLSYGDVATSQEATVALTVNPGAGSSQKLEIIINMKVVPGEITNQIDLRLGEHIPGSDVDLKIIGLNNNDDMLEYTMHTIIDYEVYGVSISDTSFEIRWNYQGLKDNYYVTRDGNGTGFSEILVTCTPDSGATNPNNCFGYFPRVDTNKYYRATVDVGDGTDKTNTVESRPIPVGQTPTGLSRLQVEQNIYWNRNGLEGSARVCFHHVESHRIERDFSHYEFVLINNQNGKWIKHKLMTNDTEGELCFSPKTIQNDIFHHTQGATLVLTQRAQDGFTVLASGENQIFLL